MDQHEIIQVVEDYTLMLVTSGYERAQAREAIVSGLRGWKAKIKRRQESGQEFYRTSASTLSARNKKKLLSKTSWYKNGDKKTGKRKYEMDEEEQEEMETRTRAKRAKRPPEEDGYQPDHPGDTEERGRPDKNKTRSVLFVPYTVGSLLAKRLREAEENLLVSTGYKIKIVERSGTKLEDLLHSSDPFKGQDCNRQECMLCETKNYTGKNTSQECSKRNLVYQIYCTTCKERYIEKIKEDTGGDKKKEQEKIKKMRLHKYVGETSRSCFERSQEHKNDMHQLKPSSHMLRHVLDMHEGEPIAGIRFGIEIVRFTRTSWERQMLESVIIQQSTSHNLLNSKSEYNRCSLPRLSTRMGENEYKKYEKQQELEKRKQEFLESRIRDMRKTRNKNRKSRTQKTAPPPKRRKTGQETFTVQCTEWETRMEKNDPENNKNSQEKRKKDLKNPAPKRMRTIKITE